MDALYLECQRLREALEESVRKNLTEGILLSGGLDTSILACLAAKWGKPTCLTVGFQKSKAPDIPCASLVASTLGLKHHIHCFGEEELNRAITATIEIMKSFDPMEIRNSAPIYIALQIARDIGIGNVMTGDAGDELFGGYSFLFELGGEQLDSALRKLWSDMSFSSLILGENLGLKVRIPFLAPEFKELATHIDSSLKVRRERGQGWGKWILRKAFESLLPEEIVWRVKMPIEEGVGTSVLPSLFSSRVSDAEFKEKKEGYLAEDRVIIRDKEHLYYYEIYRSMLGAPRQRTPGGRACPFCHSDVSGKANYCRTCGAYPLEDMPVGTQF